MHTFYGIYRKRDIVTIPSDSLRPHAGVFVSKTEQSQNEYDT